MGHVKTHIFVIYKRVRETVWGCDHQDGPRGGDQVSGDVVELTRQENFGIWLVAFIGNQVFRIFLGASDSWHEAQLIAALFTDPVSRDGTKT